MRSRRRPGIRCACRGFLARRAHSARLSAIVRLRRRWTLSRDGQRSGKILGLGVPHDTFWDAVYTSPVWVLLPASQLPLPDHGPAWWLQFYLS
jgi:hypothetical protein